MSHELKSMHLPEVESTCHKNWVETHPNHLPSSNLDFVIQNAKTALMDPASHVVSYVPTCDTVVPISNLDDKTPSPLSLSETVVTELPRTSPTLLRVRVLIKPDMHYCTVDAQPLL